MNNKKYVVWVGGLEVNNWALTFDEATRLAHEYELDGYDDVSIEEYK